MQTTDTPVGFIDKPFTVAYNTTLTKGQGLQNQSIALDSDADFILRSLYIALVTQFSAFSFNFAGPQDYYYQATQVPSYGFSQNSGQPFPILNEVHYPAGGQIKLNITDITTAFAGPFTYNIFFVGVKRFRIQQ